MMINMEGEGILDMCADLPETEIILQRGETGLGFNIRGGTDYSKFTGDSGVFVTKIKTDGAASRDQRLKSGDKIVEVNGKDIRAVTYDDAVRVFIEAGETVFMKVNHGAEEHIYNQINECKRSRDSQDPIKIQERKTSVMDGCFTYVTAGLALLATGAGLIFLKKQSPVF